MARILEYPAVKQVEADRWVLLESLEYKVNNNDDDVIVVPSGFITDFASIPQFFWSILPPFGKYSPAAVIHDWLYFTQTRKRSECDKIFLEAMEVMEVNWMTRHTMYRAVRLFGWKGWNKRKAQLSVE